MAKSSQDTSRVEVQRKTRSTKSKQDITQNDGTRTTWETIRWAGGLLLVLFSLYVFMASVSHLFVWQHDLAGLQNNVKDAEFEYSNMCGPFGSNLAHLLMGKAFGFFGILVPIIGILFGAMLLLERPKVLWRSTISIMLITICGSLTMAFAFDASESFGSGLGGDLGRDVVSKLEGTIGSMGVVFLLIGCWLLTGIITTSHFIDFLKRTTENGVEHSKGLFASLKARFAKRGGESDEEEDLQPMDDSVDGKDEVRILGDDKKRTEQQEETPAPAVEHEPVEEENPVQVPATEEKIEPEAETEQTAVAEQTEQVELTDVEPEDAESKGEELNPKSQSNIDVVEVYEHTEEQYSSAQVDRRRQFTPDSTPGYKFPSVDYLVNYESGVKVTDEEIEDNKRRIEETLGNFGVPIISMTATIGPTVTLYEIVQEPGVKIARVQGLEKDIAQSLKALGIRIIAPIPGKGTIGIEVPNKNKETVSMRSAIQSERFQNYKAELPVVIGRTIQNENFVFDLAKMPHLLVAGATGQGKSVGLNAIITSLLYRKDPSQLKFVLIDPKTVEFSLYKHLENHFLAKMESEDEAIVKDPKKAVYTLNSLVVEMENRLNKCGSVGVRNIVEYNELVRSRKVEDDIMPYIVVIIDEFADLIMTAKEVEQPVMRLAQKARAIGIHLIVATQRPDVKVITGGIKANFPARIAFRVMQMIDSRTIIDQPGANQLIGRGDMLMSDGGELTRIQCAFVNTPEVRDIVEHISEQPYPFPSGTYSLPDYEDPNASSSTESNFGSESGAPRQFDVYFADVARDAVANGKLSTSSIQSIYNVGFNRANRITRQLEQAGIVGPANGSKPRDAKIYDLMELEELLQKLGVS